MSRSGYSDDDEDPLALGRWRAQVNSAIRGKRGQRFFLDLITALDALPKPRLVSNELESVEGDVCALGALGKLRGVNVTDLDTHDHVELSETFNIASQLAAETMYVNDEDIDRRASPEERWAGVRRWAISKLRKETLVPEIEP
jgi:hypothetical protein